LGLYIPSKKEVDAFWPLGIKVKVEETKLLTNFGKE